MCLILIGKKVKLFHLIRRETAQNLMVGLNGLTKIKEITKLKRETHTKGRRPVTQCQDLGNNSRNDG